MKVVVTGARGQLGQALISRLRDKCEVIALDRNGLDIADASAVKAKIDELMPTVIVNCAAYTAVDQAETDQELAWNVNAKGPYNLATAAAAVEARLIHISTDFVFSGSLARPYVETDPVAPLSVYGKSKLAGEQTALDVADARVVVMRTSWVYSDQGANFMQTMLKLFSSRPELSVVCDQIGTPTSVYSLSRVIEAFMAKEDCQGVFHWSAAGVASWYDFAVAIAEEAQTLGVFKESVDIIPIESKDYPTAAVRPAFSVLNSRKAQRELGYRPSHWRVALRDVLRKMVLS